MPPTKGFDRDRAMGLAEAFVDYHQQHGKAYADWSAAWHCWVRKEIESNGEPNKPKDQLSDPAF